MDEQNGNPGRWRDSDYIKSGKRARLEGRERRNGKKLKGEKMEADFFLFTAPFLRQHQWRKKRWGHLEGWRSPYWPDHHRPFPANLNVNYRSVLCVGRQVQVGKLSLLRIETNHSGGSFLPVIETPNATNIPAVSDYNYAWCNWSDESRPSDRLLVSSVNAFW